MPRAGGSQDSWKTLRQKGSNPIRGRGKKSYSARKKSGRADSYLKEWPYLRGAHGSKNDWAKQHPSKVKDKEKTFDD